MTTRHNQIRLKCLSNADRSNRMDRDEDMARGRNANESPMNTDTDMPTSLYISLSGAEDENLHFLRFVLYTNTFVHPPSCVTMDLSEDI